jgi:transposase
MVRAYSTDLRERVVASVAAGRTCRETAALFGVSVASVVKWSQRQRATGSPAALPMGRARGRELEPYRAWLLERLAAEPHLTLRGLSAALAERGVSAGIVSIWRVLKEAGFSFKKNAVRQRAGSAGDRKAPGAVEEAPGEA